MAFRKKAKKARPTVTVRKWRDALEALRSSATYDELAQLGRETKEPKPLKARWPISELVVAETVFQWRGKHSDLQAEERHMRELMKVVELGRDLEPISIIQLGAHFYVVDGHHRLAAYAALGRKSIPVKAYKGCFEDAWLSSLDANVRDKLPITRQDKLEAAFTLVKHKFGRGLDLTWEEIALRTGVGERLPYKMQSFLKAALDKGHEDAFDWSWAEILRNQREEETEYHPGTDDYLNQQAREMADQIMGKVRINLTANPDITAIALRMISEELPRALIEAWQADVMEVLVGQARDIDSVEAERALRAAFTQLEKGRVSELDVL